MIKRYKCENCGNIVSEYGDPYRIDIPPWCDKCDSENGMKLMEFECSDPCTFYNKWSTSDCKCLACYPGIKEKPKTCPMGRHKNRQNHMER